VWPPLHLAIPRVHHSLGVARAPCSPPPQPGDTSWHPIHGLKVWVVHSILLFFTQQRSPVIVHVSLRGLGLAKALLGRMEDEARAVGEPVLLLETSIHQQGPSASMRVRGFGHL
jgi:GNAT superfamily N-acetyltransferase